jgi:hypothetical protein
MEFFTQVTCLPSFIRITYADSVMLFGSCFAETIGKRLMDSKFNADVNPFGVLYNPASVAMAVRRLLQPEDYTAADLFVHDGLYHSFGHHGSFSAVSESDCLRKINERLQASATRLRKANVLIVTFGTACVWRLETSGQIVANCHKLPDATFVRERLTVDQITEEWGQLLDALLVVNPQVKVIFTISPVRHWKDGAHENQLSKATLILAVEQLEKRFSGQAVCFPAYEIMMDELRDYRFYADDMLHPSDAAVRLIWERFTETYLDQPTKTLLKKVEEIQKAVNHVPLNPQNEAYRQFLIQTMLKIERLSAKMSYICFEIEKEKIRRLLQIIP